MASQKPHNRNGHSLETLEDFGGAFRDTITEETKEVGKSFLNQLLGLKTSNKSGEAPAPQPELKIPDFVTGDQDVIFNAANHKKMAESKHNQPKPAEKAPKPEKRAEAAIDHHGEVRRSSEIAHSRENREINQRLQEILGELRRLVSTSKVLQMEFANVSVEQAPTKAGEYHVNFFDWLLLTIRAARQKVEDSGAWLATAKGKKGKGKWGDKQRKDWFANTSVSMGNESGGGIINQTG